MITAMIFELFCIRPSFWVFWSKENQYVDFSTYMFSFHMHYSDDLQDSVHSLGKTLIISFNAPNALTT